MTTIETADLGSVDCKIIDGRDAIGVEVDVTRPRGEGETFEATADASARHPHQAVTERQVDVDRRRLPQVSRGRVAGDEHRLAVGQRRLIGIPEHPGVSAQQAAAIALLMSRERDPNRRARLLHDLMQSIHDLDRAADTAVTFYRRTEEQDEVLQAAQLLAQEVGVRLANPGEVLTLESIGGEA